MALPSAYAVALATVLNINRYSAEVSKKVTRFRMNRQTLCKLGNRQRLRSAFLEEYEDHLDGLGWTMIEMSDGGHAFIETASTEYWTKISTKRVMKDIRDIMRGIKSEEDLEIELEITDADDDDLIEE